MSSKLHVHRSVVPRSTCFLCFRSLGDVPGGNNLHIYCLLIFSKPTKASIWMHYGWFLNTRVYLYLSSNFYAIGLHNARRRFASMVNFLHRFHMSKGVPQGDPLSCLLFDLFIDSLSRFLTSRPDIPGVSAFCFSSCHHFV